MKLKTWEEICRMNATKEDLFKPLVDMEQVFDYALPQSWIDWIVDTHKINYEMVRCSTVWLYPQDHPCTCCKQVDDVLQKIR